VASFRLSLPLAVLIFSAGLAGQWVNPSQPAGPPDSAVSGTVYDGVTHQPVAGAVVNLTLYGGPTDANSAARVTDEKGHFVFEEVQRYAWPDGRREQRSLTAHKPGYLEAWYGRDGPVIGSFLGNVMGTLAQIVIAPGQWLENADMTLWPAASLSGTVTDEYGEPFVDQLVRVLAMDPVAGYPRWSNVGTVVTDDRGRYFVGRLAPGRYVLVAPATAAAEDAVAFRPTRYYPDAQRLSEAQPVVVAAGARLTAVDITLRPTPASRVSGRVTGAASGTWPPLLLALANAGDPDIGPTGYVATTLLEPDGTFAFRRVPLGAYVIRTSPSVSADSASATSLAMPIESFGPVPGAGPRWSLPTSPDAESAPYFARTSVTVGEADMTNVVVALSSAVTLSGVVTSDPPLAAGPSGSPSFWVFAEPADPDAGARSKDVQLDPSGAFVIDGLAPGTYFLRSAPVAVSIRSIRAAGREMADRPIDASRSVAGISVEVADGSSIHGEVRTSGTKASIRSAVIYFPSDQQLWPQVSSKSPRFGSGWVNTEGTYDIARLPGGEYYILAIPHDVSFDGWRSQAYLEAAAHVATTVRVDWGQRAQQDLQVQEVRLP